MLIATTAYHWIGWATSPVVLYGGVLRPYTHYVHVRTCKRCLSLRAHVNMVSFIKWICLSDEMGALCEYDVFHKFITNDGNWVVEALTDTLARYEFV